MARYRPQVVVTYDEHGLYGHPDHIQAHRVTMAAADTHGHPGQGVLHGGAEVGVGHHGRDHASPRRGVPGPPTRKTRTSEPRTN